MVYCRAKYDQPSSFKIAGSTIRVYSRHESYNYLGHMFNVAGEWQEHVNEICKEYSSRLDMIDQCPLTNMHEAPGSSRYSSI